MDISPRHGLRLNARTDFENVILIRVDTYQCTLHVLLAPHTLVGLGLFKKNGVLRMPHTNQTPYVINIHNILTFILSLEKGRFGSILSTSITPRH